MANIPHMSSSEGDGAGPEHNQILKLPLQSCSTVAAQCTVVEYRRGRRGARGQNVSSHGASGTPVGRQLILANIEFAKDTQTIKKMNVYILQANAIWSYRLPG